MKTISDIVILAIQLSPIFVLGVIILTAAFISFVSQAFRKRRLAMGAAFVLGTMVFVALAIVNGQSDGVLSWDFPNGVISPFTWGGLLAYGGAGAVVGFVAIQLFKVVRQLQDIRAQALVAFSVGLSFFLLFYYFFGDITLSRTIATFAIGMLVGILFQIMLSNGSLRQFLNPHSS